MKEKIDNEKPVETYKEKNIYKENITYIEDEDNLIIDNQCFLDNEEKIEIYEEKVKTNEKKVEIYEKHMEIYEEKEKSTNNENFEYYEDLIINNCLSNKINISKNISEGCCIVDICYMWNEIHRIFDDHAWGTECQFKYWQLVNFHHRGLLTQLFFKCQVCNYQTSIWTDLCIQKNQTSMQLLQLDVLKQGLIIPR